MNTEEWNEVIKEIKESETTVIRNEKGEFFGYDGKWVKEYPDARLFTSATVAGRTIASWNLKDAVEIIERYGHEDEKLYSLTMMIEGSNNGS